MGEEVQDARHHLGLDQGRAPATTAAPQLDHELHAAQLAIQVERLRSALEWTRDNFIRAVRGQPVRDMAETLAEVDAALGQGAQPEGDSGRTITDALERLRRENELLRQVALLAPRPPWSKTATRGYVQALERLEAFDQDAQPEGDSG